MKQEIVAVRRLTISSDNGDEVIEIRLYKPVRIQNDWAAAFEIDPLPPGNVAYRHQGMHVDSFGALAQAIDLLTSKLRSNPFFSKMRWIDDGDECGLRRLGDSR